MKSAASFTAGWALAIATPSQPCEFDHRQIVISIAATNHVFGGQSQMIEELLQSICLVNVTGHDLKEKRLGQIDVQQVLILLL